MCNEELKPCPFCGSKEIVLELREKGVGDKYVKCLSCVTFGPSGKTGEEAAQLWNRHAPASLKRWTAEMGTPPSGTYLRDCEIGAQYPFVAIGSNAVQWFPSGNCALSEVWSFFTVLFGPIEIEGGDAK